MFIELTKQEMQNIDGGGFWESLISHVKSFCKGFGDGVRKYFW